MALKLVFTVVFTLYTVSVRFPKSIVRVWYLNNSFWYCWLWRSCYAMYHSAFSYHNAHKW